MKTIRIFSFASIFMACALMVSAQSKTASFKVSGNCGMCKSNIEKAAKDAGAKSATWDADTKDLIVTYKSSTTNTAKIQEKIAAIGYDNVGAIASTESYNKLHGCCKYERTMATTDVAKADCCKKDGEKMDCSKMMGEKMDCCKDGKCTKEGHDGKDCCKKEGGNMDCCKDGKCTKEGHDGKDCCKKSE